MIRKKNAKYQRTIIWTILLLTSFSLAYYLLMPFIAQIKTKINNPENDTMLDAKANTQFLTQNESDWFRAGIMANTTQKVKTPQEVPLQGGWFNTSPLSFTTLQAREKVLLFYFWSPDAPKSMVLLPFINALWTHYKKSGLVVIGIYSPRLPNARSPSYVWELIQKNHITFPVLLDGTGKFKDKFKVRSIPTQYLMAPHESQAVFIKNQYITLHSEEKEIRSSLQQLGWLLPKFADALNTLKHQPRKQSTLWAGKETSRRLFGNKEQGKVGKKTVFELPQKNDLRQESLYLEGTWILGKYGINSANKKNRLLLHSKNICHMLLYGRLKASTTEPLCWQTLTLTENQSINTNDLDESLTRGTKQCTTLAQANKQLQRKKERSKKQKKTCKKNDCPPIEAYPSRIILLNKKQNNDYLFNINIPENFEMYFIHTMTCA